MVVALAVASRRLAPGNNGAPPSDSSSHSKTGNGHTVPPTILVVEDEVLIRIAVADFLRECGYRVVEAASGEEAQKIFRAGQPAEVLFSDVDLGEGIDGFELARWVRENYPGVRILLTSGVTRMAREAVHLCDAPFLDKPYSHNALGELIKRLIETFGQRSG
jgi:DNA-binding NtrC family response regulator